MDDNKLGKSSSPSLEINVSSGGIENLQHSPHGDPQLKKAFNLWNTLGIQCSITSTPLAIGTYLAVVIGVGGSPVFFFGYLLSCVMGLIICLSLCEIAAVLPHSAGKYVIHPLFKRARLIIFVAIGQIYWTSVLAPKKYSRFLSYIVGWWSCAAWFFACLSSYLIVAQLIWALVQVCRSTFVTQPWHFYTVYVAAALGALLINVPLFKIYPHLLNGLVPFLNIGAVFLLITLLVRAHPKQSASYVFTDFVNATGWPSNGVVFFLGLLPGIASCIGFDGAAHMTDELPEPATQVPKVMIGATIINSLTGIPMILAFMFCIVKPDNLLAPVGGQPLIQLFLDSMDSLALTIISTLIIIVCILAQGFTITTVFSRVWWAFAIENGVPFSGFMSKINATWNLPVNSLCFCFVASIAMGAIQLGSTTALNAFVGSLVISFFAAYSIPILALLTSRGRDTFPAQRYFNLGKFGPAINVISLLWQGFMFVWLCFPSYLPVTAADMNYAIVVFSGVSLISVVNWFLYSRKIYTSPVAMSVLDY